MGFGYWRKEDSNSEGGPRNEKGKENSHGERKREIERQRKTESLDERRGLGTFKRVEKESFDGMILHEHINPQVRN